MVRSTINKISKGINALDKAYDEAIKRIEGQLPEHSALAKRVLSWITYARRDLTAQELCHALALWTDEEESDQGEEELDQGEEELDQGEEELHQGEEELDQGEEELDQGEEEELDQDNIPDIGTIVSVCAGLVTVDGESNIIRLVHLTTQRYLVRTREKWGPTAQHKIASTCLTYLSFNAFKSGSCPSDKEFESRLKQNAFLDYAARYWGEHARTVQEQVFEVASFFLQDGNLVSCAVQTMSMSKYKYSGYSQYFLRQTTGLHLTVRFELLYLSERLLSQPSGNIGISADSKDEGGRTPLSYAAEKGHEAVVKLLVKRGDVKADSKDKNGRTPLMHAAEKGHKAVVKLLVERGDVEADSKDKGGRTPLSYAAEYRRCRTGTKPKR
jgi:hypothetical protein